MSFGLDLGTSRFRLLHHQGSRLVARQLATSYVSVPDRPAHRHLLQSAGIAAHAAADCLVVMGDHAVEVAEALQLPAIPLLPEGEFPAGDPVGRQVLMHLIQTLLRGPAPRRVPCTLVLPADAGFGDPAYEFFVRVLRLLNYQPVPLPAAQAVVLAELGQDLFTGIGLSLGAGRCSACVVRRGVPLSLVSVPCGGNAMDFRLAETLKLLRWDAEGHRYLDLVAAARWKCSPDRSLTIVESEAEAELRDMYLTLLSELCSELAHAASRHRLSRQIDQPLPIVCQGGATQISGFAELLRNCWNEAAIDLPTSEIRRALHGDWAVARGCVIHNELGMPGQDATWAA